MEGDQSRDRHEGSSPEVKTFDSKYIERGVRDFLQRESSCRTDGSAIRDCELQEKSHRLVKGNDVVAIGEERTEIEPPTASTYRNDSGDLYAEDVDKHMAFVPEVDIPEADISLEDIQVGDPGEPLSSDQTMLRQLIYGHIAIYGSAKVMPYPLRLVEQSVILMSETLTQSHKGYDRSHPSFAKSWPI